MSESDTTARARDTIETRHPEKPRTCTVCTNPHRPEIDRELVSGAAYRSIAQRFRISPDAVFRHKGHLSKLLVKAREVEEVQAAGSLLDQVRALQARAEALLATAEKAKNWRAGVAAIRECRGCLELIGRVTGEIANGNRVQVLNVNGTEPAAFRVPSPDLRDERERIALSV